MRWRRLPLLLLAGAGLVFGLWAGLIRLGVPLAPRAALAVWAHGPLMVCGFFGTLIALERAAAADRWWAWGAPMLSGGAMVALLAGVHWQVAAVAWTLAGVWLTVTSAYCIRRERSLHGAIILAGAAAWAVGSGLWAGGWPVMRAVFWWMAFLVLTIAGERLELGRLTGRRRVVGFLAAVGLFLAGVTLSGWFADVGVRLAGAGLVALAVWLWRNDIARRTIRMRGIARYSAACLLAGYVWLGVGGALCLLYGAHAAGFAYDALLHAVFVGFVFSMVFGHAPIIAPALLRVPLPKVDDLYLPLGLLHLSLVIRVVGDAGGWFALRRAGGMVNALSIGLFLVTLVLALRAARRARARRTAAATSSPRTPRRRLVEPSPAEITPPAPPA